MPMTLKITVNEVLYLRDPMETELGRKIVDHSIKLIDTIGFEQFTFKKLAKKINSTEASMYRYFESKQKLVGYLLSWYWLWLAYLIEFRMHNLEDPERQLEVLLEILTQASTDDPTTAQIDEAALHRIVVRESAKAYSVKQLSAKEKKGLYQGYEEFLAKAVKVVRNLNPKYKYPKSLVVMIVETIHKQLFDMHYFPSATDIKGKKGSSDELIGFVEDITLKVLS